MPEKYKISFSTASAYFAGTVLSGLIAVMLAAANGLIIAYLFPQTFTAFMALIGLGKYELWQLAAVLAYVAFLLKPFRT